MSAGAVADIIADPGNLAASLLAKRQQTMIGVIDIGSNSLRLVLYDGNSRAPVPLFNEKVMCALGRGLNVTGRLNPDGLVLARDNIERFVMLTRQIGVRKLDIIATSAVRDASDGREFVADIEQRCGVKINVIGGVEEGRLAAAGVRAGIPDADGIAGDLGGGSVELAITGPHPSGFIASLPIGPLRLLEGLADDSRARAEVDQAIASLPWLAQAKGRPFYSVGGTWRALARLHMEQEHYPLHVIQNYAVPRSDFESFLDLMIRQSRRSMEKVLGLSRKRLETIPLAAYILHRLLRVIQPSQVIFSAYGLREGHLLELLDADQRGRDPLLVATKQMADANPRFGAGGAELLDWTGPLFPDETAAQRRLRHAAALISDIGWADHPDYRAEQVFTRCLRMPVPGLDHPGRVFIANILHARYGGEPDAPLIAEVSSLLDPAQFERARAIGLAFRLAYTLTGAAPGLIGRTGLVVEPTTLTLSVPEHTAIFTGEAVTRRFEALGRVLGRRVLVQTATSMVETR